MGDCVQAQLGLFSGHEIGSLTSYAHAPSAPSDHPSSLFVKDITRNGSPPWREDDKDGHYMFEIGDNLTSRCNDLHYHKSLYFLFASIV